MLSIFVPNTPIINLFIIISPEIIWPLFQRSARSSHRPRNDRGMSKNSSPRSRLDLGLSLILVSSLVSVSKKVKNPRNSSFFPRNDRGMRKKSSPRSRLDLGLGQANSLELDLGLEKGALADLWPTGGNFSIVHLLKLIPISGTQVFNWLDIEDVKRNRRIDETVKGVLEKWINL